MNRLEIYAEIHVVAVGVDAIAELLVVHFVDFAANVADNVGVFVFGS